MADTLVRETRSGDSAGTVKKPYNSLFLEECCSLYYTEKFHSPLLWLYIMWVAGVWLYMATLVTASSPLRRTEGRSRVTLVELKCAQCVV